jgi:hypothetical protein
MAGPPGGYFRAGSCRRVQLDKKGERTMQQRVSVPLVLLVYVVVGVIVAINKDYGDIDNADQAATFVLGVILWPILAFDGAVAVRF